MKNENTASAVGSSMLLGIMMCAFCLVNASAKELPARNQTAKMDVKDAVKKDIDRLVEILLKTGQDGQIPENLAPDLGFPGSMPAKGLVITGINCILIYEEDETGTLAVATKRPLGLYLNKGHRSGLDTEDQYYRISLDGRLEKLVLMRGKVDEAGQPVAGTLVVFNQDIGSSDVKKAFAAEMRKIRSWLKQQKKPSSKAAAMKAAP